MNAKAVSAKREIWGGQRAKTIAAIKDLHGGLPSCSDRVRLKVSTESSISRNTYQIQELRYSVSRDRPATGRLFVPRDAKAAGTSGIVCISEGRTSSTADEMARRLVETGYVCLVPELVSPIDRDGTMDIVWQAMRAADALQATPEVHGERIGLWSDTNLAVTGLYIAALDQRFVTTCIDANDLTRNGSSTIDSDKLGELLSLAAPRSVRVTLSSKLGDVATEWKAAVARAKNVFDLVKATTQLEFVESLSAADRIPAYVEWLQSKLPPSR